MNVLRVLTLYKQHYLENYEKPLKFKYSCFNYYDGMDIKEVASANKRLLKSKGNINFTDMWYRISENICEEEGIFSQQNISLLRYEDDSNYLKGYSKDADYWKNSRIFLCASFLQFSGDSNNNYLKEIEIRINSSIGRPEAILYRTFDNADAVLFLKSNSYSVILNEIESLSQDPFILYTHSVCGVSQEFLEIFKSCNFDWKCSLWGDNQLVNDTFSEVVLEIVANGNTQINKLKAYFSSPDKGRWSYVLGHSDLIIKFNNMEISNLIKLLEEGEILNHYQSCYGKGIYNIQTIIKVKETPFQSEKNNNPKNEEENTPSSSWCRLMIQKLKTELQKIKNGGAQKTENMQDERIISYYLAMIQSLNMLSQYENSGFSKVIFNMIFPSLSLFYRQFEEGLRIKANGKKDKQIDPLSIMEDSVTKYLEAIDEIIYHSIHTDQNFLMIPGYSGSLYEVPSKLCIMYMSYIRKVIEILKDECYQYECFLVPRVNAKIRTKFINFGLQPNNRLIQVSISQRMLFMPRSMLFMLAHEVAHYVGKEPRARNERLAYMVRIAACVLTENIFDISEKADSIQMSLVENMKRLYRTQVSKYFTRTIAAETKRYLKDYGRDLKTGGDTNYHSDIIGKILPKVCRELLLDSDGELRKCFYCNNDVFREYYEKGEKELCLEAISNVQCQLENRITALLVNGFCEEMVSSLFLAFKEMYADVIAILCLDIDWEYYIEGFVISEGYNFNKNVVNILLINRVSAVVSAISSLDPQKKEKWHKLVNNSNGDDIISYIIKETNEHIEKFDSNRAVMFTSNKRNASQEDASQACRNDQNVISQDFDSIQKAVSDMFRIDAVWNYEKEYLCKCIGLLNKKCFKEKKEKLDFLRSFYLLFGCYEENSDKCYSELFNNIDKLINQYSTSVEEQRQKEIRDLQSDASPP